MLTQASKKWNKWVWCFYNRPHLYPEWSFGFGWSGKYFWVNIWRLEFWLRKKGV